MRVTGFAWECSCGNMEYMEDMPEECNKCGSLDSFLKMPEDLLKAREQDMVEEDTQEKPSLKSKTTKVKKTTGSKRK